MKLTRQALLALFFLALTSSAYAANPCATGGAPFMRDGSGAGGTGNRAEAGDGTGQGGSGILANTGDGTGQGGTGIRLGKQSDGDGSGSGGTGNAVEVDGVVTGFASICVNGLELHYSPTTPVTLNGNMASIRDLNIGQVVRALAHGKEDQLTLQRIAIRHLMVAPVQALGMGKLRAQDQSIGLSAKTILPAGLAPGDKVAVSGFAGNQGKLIATRLDVVPNDTPDSLSGEVQRDAQGHFTINGVVLSGNRFKLDPGDLVRAEGHFAAGRLEVSRIEHEERMQTDRIVIQGYVRHTAKSDVSLNGQRFLIDSRTLIKQAPPRIGEWAKIDAVLEGKKFHAREIDAQGHPGDDITKPPGKYVNTQGTGRAGKADKQTPESHAIIETEHSTNEVTHLEKPEAPEKIEAPELPEKVEAPERPEKIEAPERPEKVEAPERPEKIEAPELPEKIETH